MKEIDINKLIGWLSNKANKSNSWLERTAYLEVIRHIKGKQ